MNILKDTINTLLKGLITVCSLIGFNYTYATQSLNDVYFDYLSKEYAQYDDVLRAYSKKQGFIYSEEMRLTVLHEKIHLDQAKHWGYKIINKGYTPFFLDDITWGYVNNQYYLKHISVGVDNIYRYYLSRNMQLNLGNLIDELNVYHLLINEFIKKADNNVVLEKQYNNIAHLLKYSNLYFGVLRKQQNQRYLEMKKNKELVQFLKDLYFELYGVMDKSVFNKVYDKTEVLIFLR